MNGSYDAVAGIANLGQNDLNSVFTSINASQLTATGQNKKIYPISHSSPVLFDNYYDSTILPTVTAVTNVQPKTSSELDTLPLDGWYNGENSDLRYPIPTAIIDTFGESSCWDTLSNLLSIPENTTPGDSPDYVPDAYFVNGEDGDDDNNNGLSIDDPYQKLTTAITQAIESGSRTVYVSGTLTPSNQGITDPSSGEHEQYSVFYIQDNAFDDVVEIIGVSENTNFSGNNETRIFSTKNACNFKMKNINFINGNTIGSGAAIYFWQGSLELDSCKISGNSSTLGNAYNGIYNYGGSVLKMTNTTCENSVYLSNTTATIGSNCTIGTSDTTATDGFITLDESTLILDGKNIDIYKPIYINNQNARIELGDNFEQTDIIQIKINPLLASGFPLFENPPDNLLDLFELVESEDFTLGADGQIEKK